MKLNRGYTLKGTIVSINAIDHNLLLWSRRASRGLAQEYLRDIRSQKRCAASDRSTVFPAWSLYRPARVGSETSTDRHGDSGPGSVVLIIRDLGGCEYGCWVESEMVYAYSETPGTDRF